MHWESDARRIEVTCAIPIYNDELWLHNPDCVPSTSKEEILAVTGIGPATLDGIKELITVEISP
jgi:hypothetical protein